MMSVFSYTDIPRSTPEGSSDAPKVPALVASGPARPAREPPASPPDGGKRLKLLCLHGWRSNNDVTSMQLSNLGLDIDEHYGEKKREAEEGCAVHSH